MAKLILLAALISLVSAPMASAQSVSESWLRQAAISCGGGQTEEVRAEVESRLIAQFQAVGEKRQDNTMVGDVELLLRQFDDQAKTEAYKNYAECLKGLVQLVVDNSDLPARDVVLDADVALAGLSTAKRGDRILMLPGDTIAINDWSLIFTVEKVGESNGGKRVVYFTWSDSESGQSQSQYAFQGTTIDVADTCTLVPYQIDTEALAVSLIVNCK